MSKVEPRIAWVSYLRVSTAEQAERDLSLPAQRRAVEDYATRNGQSIFREYIEEGCSGTHMNRKAFRQMLEDVFRPGSDIGTIVVHHTSRFTRNACRGARPRWRCLDCTPSLPLAPLPLSHRAT